jgi:predicted acetyltransferase
VKIAVLPAALDDETTLRNLFQFYEYEFSRFMGWLTTSAGKFYEIDLDGCWTDPNRHPFLIRVDGNPAGFAIIDMQATSAITGEANVIEMREFFILAALQGQGIGAYAAAYLFDQFPGKWEVFELLKNVDAQPFWRKVIGRYTNNQYHEAVYEAHDGIVQSFDNSR